LDVKWAKINPRRDRLQDHEVLLVRRTLVSDLEPTSRYRARRHVVAPGDVTIPGPETFEAGPIQALAAAAKL
jgi:hypothetical protein